MSLLVSRPVAGHFPVAVAARRTFTVSSPFRYYNVGSEMLATIFEAVFVSPTFGSALRITAMAIRPRTNEKKRVDEVCCTCCACVALRPTLMNALSLLKPRIGYGLKSSKAASIELH